MQLTKDTSEKCEDTENLEVKAQEQGNTRQINKHEINGKFQLASVSEQQNKQAKYQ